MDTGQVKTYSFQVPRGGQPGHARNTASRTRVLSSGPLRWRHHLCPPQHHCHRLHLLLPLHHFHHHHRHRPQHNHPLPQRIFTGSQNSKNCPRKWRSQLLANLANWSPQSRRQTIMQPRMIFNQVHLRQVDSQVQKSPVRRQHQTCGWQQKSLLLPLGKPSTAQQLTHPGV